MDVHQFSAAHQNILVALSFYYQPPERQDRLFLSSNFSKYY